MKQLILTITTFALVMLSATAAAANSPELTYPTGTRLATGSAIQTVSVGEAKLTSATSTTTCSGANFEEASLSKNNGSELEIDIPVTRFQTSNFDDCNSTGNLIAAYAEAFPWCLKSTPAMAEDEFQVASGKCSEGKSTVALTVQATSAGSMQCVYERSGAITGSFKTHPEDAVLTSSEMEIVKVSGSLFCPSSTKLDTSLTFESDGVAPGPLYLSAGPRLTFPTGTTLAVGTKIRGQGIGETKMTSGGTTLACPVTEVTGTLKKNTGTEVEADIESAAFAGTGTAASCTSTVGDTKWVLNSTTNGLPWCLRATSKMVADEFQIRGNNCASASRPIRYVYETMTTTECHYQKATPLTGTFATHPEDALLSFAKATFLETEPKQAVCPDETQLDTSLTLKGGVGPAYIS